jgi:hypothetical protein
MPTRWHVAETRRLIMSRHGLEQLALARPSLRAVVERLGHARYHFQEAKSLLKTHIDDQLDKDDIYTLTFPTEMAEWNAMESWLARVEANMIACAQSIHSIPDTLAHVVYFAVGLNLGPTLLRERDVNVRTVVKSLVEQTPIYSEVVNAFQALRRNPSFIVLDAFVNCTKHRGAAEPRLSIAPIDRVAQYAMEFGTFAYDGVKHPERELEDVLAPAYGAMSCAVIDVGSAINSVILACSQELAM